VWKNTLAYFVAATKKFCRMLTLNNLANFVPVVQVKIIIICLLWAKHPSLFFSAASTNKKFCSRFIMQKH
jgi:hypothetical protein